MNQIVFRLFAGLVLCLTLALPAWGGQWFGVAAPAVVGAGKPFCVRISSIYPVDELTVEWDGGVVHPAIERRGDLFEAVLMLGTRLDQEPGAMPLEMKAHLWGRNFLFSREVSVKESLWDRETLRVAPGMVHPPEKVMARIKRERKQIRAAVETLSPQRHWELPFARPAKGKMLSRFGLHRVFNGDVKARHTGLDFRAWQGTPLYAMAAGKVVLTGSFYYAGKAVFIDHGNGLVSVSAHMSRVLVRQGDMVEAGQEIGLSGATGRATGAHLHLGIFALGKPVDPEPFFDGKLESNFNEIRIILMDNK